MNYELTEGAQLGAKYVLVVAIGIHFPEQSVALKLNLVLLHFKSVLAESKVFYY